MWRKDYHYRHRFIPIVIFILIVLIFYCSGISHAYGGVLSALSIHYTLTPLNDDGATGSDQRWTEREVVSALYPDHTEIIVDEEREVVGAFDVY
jgi:hypothetical protein